LVTETGCGRPSGGAHRAYAGDTTVRHPDRAVRRKPRADGERLPLSWSRWPTTGRSTDVRHLRPVF